VNASAQEQALLDLIAADRARRCSEILQTAQRQSDELLHEAHRHARERLRQALNEARERARQRVAGAIAQRQTRARLAQQSSASEFLTHALQRLPAALTQRWQQACERRRWVQMALAQAQQSLPAGPWRIEHADGLQAEDISALGADAGDAANKRFQLNAQLVAGLRIFGNGNCIDASLPGLLSDRENLAAALLQAWEQTP